MILPAMAELEAAGLARRCVICDASACVTCPGDVAVFEDRTVRRKDGATRRYRVLVKAAVPGINLCLAHAAERWPWKSERSHRHRQRTP